MDLGSDRLPLWRVKQPLVAITLFFTLGILLQYHFQFLWKPFLLIALGGSLAWMIVSWSALAPPWPIAPWAVTAGMLLTACQWMSVEGSQPNHLKSLVLRLPQHMVLRGVVWTDPTLYSTDDGEETSDKKVPSQFKKQTDGVTFEVRSGFELKVSAVKFHTVWEPACGLVQVRARYRVSKVETGEIPSAASGNDVEFGQEIEVDGVLSPPPATRNFGLFDFAAYLRRVGIHHVFLVDGVDSIRVLGPVFQGKWIFAARRKLAERLTLGIENDTVATGIIRGMLLGYREDIPPDVNDAFRRSGTLHVFAISGSHITLIALALLVGLRQMRIPQSRACWMVLPILIFYVAATGLRASAVRSLVMAAVVIIGWSLQRPSALLNNLAASALVILAWDPLQLFDAGFQLSFGVVASLILFAPLLDQKIREKLEPDPYIPRICIPRWRLALLTPIRWIAALMAVCLAAWVGSFGLNLYYFNLISFVAILANVLIVPLASASVALGLVSLLMGVLWNQLAITLNTTHALLIHTMVTISERLAGWEFGFLYAPQPPVGWVVAGYVVLLIIVLLWMKRKKVFSLGLTVLSVAAIGLAVFTAWKMDRVRIDILDVGGGQAVLITGPRFERVLVDAGSRSQGRFVVEPFLRSRGVNVLDLAILTHGDAAHYGGFSELLQDVPIRRMIVSDARFRSKGYRQLLEKVHQTQIPVETWSEGNSTLLNSGKLTVLWPPKDLDHKRADDLGLVLKLGTRHGCCLLASDAGESVEKAIASLPQDSSLMLVQGIHSNEDSLTESYLQSLKPLFLVLNTAEYPFKAYPSPGMQERLQKSGIRVYYTDRSGGVKVLFERGGIQVRSYFPQ